MITYLAIAVGAFLFGLLISGVLHSSAQREAFAEGYIAGLVTGMQKGAAPATRKLVAEISKLKSEGKAGQG